MFVSISQVIGCEDRLRNDLYCVEWGVKLYSNQTKPSLLALFAAYRSNNFVVGLSNSSPAASAPVLWHYTLCGQYPGHVTAGATVSVQCAGVCEQRLRFRYVIVQFPLAEDRFNFCEVEVFAIGTTVSLRCDRRQRPIG